MPEPNSSQKPVHSPRREFLKAFGSGIALSLSAGEVGAVSEKRNEPEQAAVQVASVTQGSITSTIRDANDGVDFSTSGGGAIRNVGFQSYRSAGTPLVTAAVTTSGGSAVIDGCYFGDGGSGPAVFVAPSHAGTLTIRNCYFEGWANNAIYGSPPGNPSGHPNPGRGGVVEVENCYATGNAVANFRLGTDGSHVANCVSLDSQRGYWGFYNATRVIDCDIADGVFASDNSWQDPAVVTVENTRFSGRHLHYSGATIDGTSQGTPRDYYPGVPLSPADAKDGNMS